MCEQNEDLVQLAERTRNQLQRFRNDSSKRLPETASIEGIKSDQSIPSLSVIQQKGAVSLNTPQHSGTSTDEVNQNRDHLNKILCNVLDPETLQLNDPMAYAMHKAASNVGAKATNQNGAS